MKLNVKPIGLLSVVVLLLCLAQDKKYDNPFPANKDHYHIIRIYLSIKVAQCECRQIYSSDLLRLKIQHYTIIAGF